MSDSSPGSSGVDRRVTRLEAPGQPTRVANGQINRAVMTKVLVVDDYYDRRQLMSHVVALCGTDVSVVGYADSPSVACSAVERSGVNVALIEMQLPSALETIRSLRADHPNVRIVVCSFRSTADAKRSALSEGADVYLTKPIGPRDLNPHLRASSPNRLDSSHQR
jgi:CheY-like chemotaxis protein